MGASLTGCGELARDVAEAPWTDANPYCVELTVDPGADPTRAVSFSLLPAIDGALDPDSVRFVELGPVGAPLEREVIFQHDSDVVRGEPDEWVFRVREEATPVGAHRVFLYFDTQGVHTAPTFEPDVELTEGLDGFGEESLFIATAAGLVATSNAPRPDSPSAFTREPDSTRSRDSRTACSARPKSKSVNSNEHKRGQALFSGEISPLRSTPKLTGK